MSRRRTRSPSLGGSDEDNSSPCPIMSSDEDNSLSDHEVDLLPTQPKKRPKLASVQSKIEAIVSKARGGSSSLMLQEADHEANQGLKGGKGQGRSSGKRKVGRAVKEKGPAKGLGRPKNDTFVAGRVFLLPYGVHKRKKREGKGS